MKKILMSLFVLGLFAFSFQAHASVLSDALLKIENLTKELSQLKLQLKASVGDYDLSPKITVIATPSTIPDGGIATISWTSEYTNECDFDGHGAGTEGSFQTPKLGKDTTYTITCTSSRMGGTAKGSVTVKVPTAPSITVLSPNGGYTYKAGQKVTVKWKSKNMTSSEKVLIEVINLADANNGGGSTTLVASTPNDGSESVTLGSNLITGTYKIAVKGSNANDMSDKTFTIKAIVVKTSLSILSPKYGANYKTGDKVTVSWKSTGISTSATGSLKLGVKDLKGVVTNRDSFNNLINDGSEVITIPSDAPSGSSYVFSFSISDVNNKLQTATSSVFSIAPAKPVITVLSPNDDEGLITVKQKIDIKWSSNLDPVSYVNIYVSDGKHKGHVARTKNSGVFSYTLDKVLTVGEGYKAYVTSVSKKIVTDSSDEAFSIQD